MRQLGLQVIVQPYSVGPVTFGNSVYLQPGNRAKPGAFSITALQVRSEDEAEKVSSYSQQILQEMARMPGVISVLLARAGHRMLTVTAWEDAESPGQMFRGGTHRGHASVLRPRLHRRRRDERLETGAHQRAVGALRVVRQHGRPRPLQRDVSVRPAAPGASTVLVRKARLTNRSANRLKS